MTSKEDINTLIKNLQKEIENEDNSSILLNLEKLIETEKDEDYMKMKILVLLENREFEKLEKFYEDKKLFSKFPYEYCYSLFIQKKNTEALEFYNKHETQVKKEKPVSHLYIIAQIHYALGDYKKASEIYKELIFKHKKDDGETYTNYIASLVLSGESENVVGKEILEKSDSFSGEENFEFFYNIACAFIELNDLKNANEYLDRSEKVCKQQDEEVTPEELEVSLTPIKVQTAYIKQILGNVEEAQKIYFEILNKKPKGQDASIAVASNNIVSILKGNQSVFEASKKIKVATRYRNKLTTTQQRGLDLNRILLLIRMKKFDECEKLFEELEKQFPGTDIPTLLQASLAYKQKNFVDSVNILKKFIDHTEKSSNVEMCLAQLHVNRNELEKALQILEESYARHSLPVVGCLVGIYRKLNRIEESKRIFEESVKYWKENKKDDKKIVELIKNQAEFLFSIGDNEKAIQAYTDVLKIDQKNDNLKAGMVLALVDRDLKRSEEIAKTLKEVEVGKYGGEKLIRIPVHLVKERKKKKVEFVDDGANILLKKKGEKKRKKRKNKKPKVMDGKIDPERWMPKWEREKNKAKVNQKKAKRYQGAVNKSAQSELDSKKKNIKKKIQKSSTNKGKTKRKGRRRK